MAMIGVFGSTLAFSSTNLVDILFLGYSVWVPTIVVPFAFALYRREHKGSTLAATSGILAGIIGYAVAQFLKLAMVPPLVLGLVCNLIVFLVVSKTTKPDNLPVASNG
jgi:Na+/pantothenate symporter